MKGGIESLLSENTMNLHREYLRTQKLRYSVIEKSEPIIEGKNCREISRMRLKGKKEILDLKSDIECHEIFFNSFGEQNQRSLMIRNQYRTESSFMYGLYESSRKLRCGFLIIYLEKGEVRFVTGAPELITRIENPVLAIDLCEHSYFLDYGFDVDSYLKKMISHLNFGKLDIFSQSRIEKK